VPLVVAGAASGRGSAGRSERPLERDCVLCELLLEVEDVVGARAGDGCVVGALCAVAAGFAAVVAALGAAGFGAVAVAAEVDAVLVGRV
jgi:predicted phage tail protein